MITVTDQRFGSTTLGHTTTTPDPDSETNSNLDQWVGECDKCMKNKYAFRQKSVDSRDDDGNDTRPPKLRRVEWRFCDTV